MKSKHIHIAALAAMISATTLFGQTETPAAQASASSLIKNGSLEDDADANGWPDHWPSNKSATRPAEEGNHFIRLQSSTSGQTVMLYQSIRMPQDAKALRLSWRQRITDLKPGKQPWFDARIMLEFRNSADQKIPGSPGAPYARKSTDGWQSRSIEFLVPEGAAALALMPALFQVETGTFDLDDVELQVIDSAALITAKAAADEAKAAKTKATAEGRQSKAAALFEKTGNLIGNGDFETAGKSGEWPADWPGLKENGSWGSHPEGGRFLRMESTVPDKTVMVFRNLTIPAGVKALELKWRWRITGLKPGAQPWFDARFMMDFKDASDKKLKPQPSAPYSRRDTKGAWEEKSVRFLVPEGAISLDIMPSLFNVKAGTMDLDDFVLRPSDAEPVFAQQREREAAAAKTRVPREEPDTTKWPKPIRVVGNKILNSEDKEVWLQGLNIPSLEWSVGGEQVLKSTIVAIDEWKSNVIRIPVKEEYWFGRSGQSDGGKSYRDVVDQMITLASNRGAYVILDLHRYRAPKPEFLEFWKDAAAKYKDHPALIFDLMNEPHGISWEIWRNGGFVGEKKDADQAAFLTAEEKAKAQGFESPGMQAMLDAVRSTGAKNVVLVGALDYAYQLDGILNGHALEDKTGNGIIYATHVYPWKKGWQKYFLDAAAKHPILLGEVGGDANKMDFMPHNIQEDVATWAPDMLGLIQKHKLHWTGWCFHPKASPRMILDWDYTPTPFWGQLAKDALAGKQFELKKLR